MKVEDKKYKLTFTSGTLMVNETCAVATAFIDSGCDWAVTRERTFRDNLLEKDKETTKKKVFSLVKQRISTLSKDELSLLIDGAMTVKRQMALLGVCKVHALIFDFISVNVRNSFFDLQEKITYANFNEFLNEKKYEHTNLDNIADTTASKIRQAVFRILEQSELIESSNSGLLHRPYLSEDVERSIVMDDPKWLAIFLYSNNEINNACKLYE